MINNSDPNLSLSPLKQDVQRRKLAKDKKHHKNKLNWDEANKVITDLDTGLGSYQALIYNIKRLPDIYPPDIKTTMLIDLQTMESDIVVFRNKIQAIINTYPRLNDETEFTTIPTDNIPDFLVVYEELMSIGEDILNVINPISLKCYATFLEYAELYDLNKTQASNLPGTNDE